MDISEASLERGRRVRQALGNSPSPRSASNSAAFDLVPELEEYALGVNFGEIWSRPQLDAKTRCGLTLAMLTALGLEPQIKSYVGYALNVGWSPEEIAEVFVQAVSYCGLPKALNGLRAAGDVFQERGLAVGSKA